MFLLFVKIVNEFFKFISMRFLFTLIPLKHFFRKLSIESDSKFIDCKLLNIIRGLNAFNSKCPCKPATETPKFSELLGRMKIVAD